MSSILITGGSGKVGFSLVRHFLERGRSVVTTSRNRERFFEQKGSELSQDQIKDLKVIEVDFMSEDAVDLILSALSNQKISVETIIHNARSLEFLKIEANGLVTVENFAGEFHMDVIIPYRLSMEISKVSESLKNIIFISSMYGVVAPTPSLYDDFSASSPIQYGVSKAAQIHLTKELAVRLAPRIRTNCISFGGIKGRIDEGFERRYNKMNPLGKMLLEEDVIGPVDFLVSDNSKNMTGQNIIVDGGWSIW